MMIEHSRPIVTSGGLIVAPDGEVLLVRSYKWGGRYTTPGGKVEDGETCTQAFIREVKEETGLDVEDVQFAMVQDCIYSDEFYKKNHFVMNDFYGKLSTGSQKEDVRLNAEADAYLWLTPQKACSLQLTKECRNLLHWYLERTSHKIKIGIERLEVESSIGVYEHEKNMKQSLIIDFKIEIEPSNAVMHDSISETVDYDLLVNVCRSTASEKHFHLLETYAESVLQKVVLTYPILSAWICVRKPSAIRGASAAFVEREWRKSV